MGINLLKQGVLITTGNEVNENLATCNTIQYNVAASTGNWNYFWITSSTALEPNTTYTFSAEVEVSDNYERCTVYNYTASGKSGEINYYFPADGKRHSWTFTTTSNALGVIAYAGTAGSTANYSAVYKNIKLEKGDKATPWIPNKNDVIYISSDVTFEEISEEPVLFGKDWITANEFYEF